jgi:hypothetical protein
VYTVQQALCIWVPLSLVKKADIIYRKESKWVVLLIFRIHGSEVWRWNIKRFCETYSYWRILMLTVLKSSFLFIYWMECEWKIELQISFPDCYLYNWNVSWVHMFSVLYQAAIVIPVYCTLCWPVNSVQVCYWWSSVYVLVGILHEYIFLYLRKSLTFRRWIDRLRSSGLAWAFKFLN